MRLLVTSDWHLDAVTAGLGRRGEVEAFAAQLGEVLEREQVDVFLHLGDVMDPGNMRESAHQRVLLKIAAELNRRTRYGSIWIPGNHDVFDESEPTSTLSPMAAAAEAWAYREPNPLQVVELPRLVVRELPEERGHFLCLPYVSRAAMNTEAYRVAFANAFREAEGKKNVVVLSHLSLPGMHPGSEDEMPRGREVPFPVDYVKRIGPSAVLQGHYHSRQRVSVGGLQVDVVGAPVRFTFGERADGPRGFLFVDV